ncbi:TorF family putative porin [Noviherbaspirillum denitrificans]|uniref:Uncharacterized protein n=1 Tax=Noviherbaspirillum denitrificans TaxID=1968433 RepID=A0A254TG59_9BURK|nr:TorF family putative porin [Noviherbaspirillum denitrificans]OWW21594.1 hypothetical protein AYR66_20995 [Noviherbaspirillum denitrificans]
MYRIPLTRNNLAVALAATALLGAGSAQAEDSTFTGHVDLVSKYILRGASTTYGPGAPLGNGGADAPESDKPVLQWGVDWTHPSGVYLGYFGSQINYSYKRLGELYSNPSVTNFQSGKSIENDFYGGYNGKAGDFGYTVGLTGYAYINGKHANAFETKLAVSYAEFTLAAQTLLNDVVWGNKGDTYWTFNYTRSLPYNITFLGSLGYYTYSKEGKFLGTRDTFNGAPCGAGSSFAVVCTPGNAPSSGGFRHLILGVTQPVGDSGLTWGLQGIVGGDNRFGVKQNNRLVASLSYGF